MSSQFVDINSDGHYDILCGSFCGVPQIIMGTEDGYSVPENLLDSSGQTVLIADFWNYDSEKWDKTDRAQSEGHCTSSEFVDWDNDGDLDLLLGDYYGGRLYLRMNEGTAEEPSFATTNLPVLVNGKPLVIEHGLAAPKIIDWNEDGKFDLLCGGSKGGVFLFENSGTATEPKFVSSEAIIEPVDDPTNSFIRRVPAVDGQPTLPGSSYHLEVFDYDGDGDQDLLVGGRSSWVNEPKKELNADEQSRLVKVTSDYQTTMQELVKLTQEAETTDEQNKIAGSEEYQTLIKKMQELAQEREALQPSQGESGDFVWVYLRR